MDAAADTGSGGATDGGCPPSWVVTYRLDGDAPPGPPAPFDRTIYALRSGGALINVGDHGDVGWQCTSGGQDCLGVGPGRLKIRLRDAGGQPADGKVTLVSYENAYNFRISFVDSFLTIDADGVLPPSPLEPDHPAPVCEAAVGALSGKRLVWTTPIVDHRTHGTVVCNTTPAFCSLGGLNAGPNTRDDTFAVLFKPFVFTVAPGASQNGEFYLDEGANPTRRRRGSRSRRPIPACRGARSFC